MPFGLRLKKTRRYNVTSKNSYVARIQLLDNTLLELTLTPESLGQDCLDTIAQRLQLEEVGFQPIPRLLLGMLTWHLPESLIQQAGTFFFAFIS